jgi:hypothetical protein
MLNAMLLQNKGIIDLKEFCKFITNYITYNKVFSLIYYSCYL